MREGIKVFSIEFGDSSSAIFVLFGMAVSLTHVHQVQIELDVQQGRRGTDSNAVAKTYIDVLQKSYREIAPEPTGHGLPLSK
jgi:hypothetical protein